MIHLKRSRVITNLEVSVLSIDSEQEPSCELVPAIVDVFK